MDAGRAILRRVILPLLLLVAVPAAASDATSVWLARASDAGQDARRREFAAGQIVMLADPSASILLTALRGDDGHDGSLRRQVAARILGQLGLPGAEAALLEAAMDSDWFVAEAAKEALSRLYARLPDGELYTLFTRGARERHATPGGVPEDEEDWIALSLARSRHQGDFKALVMRGMARKYAGDGPPLPDPLAWCVWDALLDANVDLRLAAVALLPRAGDSRATEKLAALLYTENNVKVLAAALRAMRALRPPDYGEAVERQTRHADPLVALEALGALDAMGYRGVLVPAGPGARTVAGFVNHPSTPVRRRAIELLIESNNPAALEPLEAALFDRVAANRALAAWGLGEMGLGAAVGALSPLLRDGRPEVRCEAAVALSRLGVVGVAAGVLDDLASGAPPFRHAAARALGRIGDARAVPALTAALDADDADLACAAATALGVLGDKRAGGALFDAMRRADGDAMLADACRRALTELYLDDPGPDPAGWDAWGKRYLGG